MSDLKLINSLSFELPSLPQQKISIGNLLGSGMALTLAEIVKQHLGMVIAIVPDSVMAAKLERELTFFLGDELKTYPLFTFPDWETLPYDTFSPHQDIVSERLTTLYRLPHITRGILIVPVATLMQRLCPKEFLFQNTLVLKKKDKMSLKAMRIKLSESAYRLVPQVMEHGEFAIRGSILDLFPMGSLKPFRIDFFDDEVDSLRTFNVETQRSEETMEELCLLPAHEFPMTVEGIGDFRTRFRTQFEGDPRQSSVYLDVSDGHVSPGLEYYLPLFFEKTSHLFDYFGSQTLIVRLEDIEFSANSFWQEVKNRYEQYRHDRLRPLLEPKALFLQPNEILSMLKAFPQIQLSEKPLEESTGHKNLPFSNLPPLALEFRQEKPLDKLNAFLENYQGRVLFSVESNGRREIIKELLAGVACRPKDIENFAEFLENDFRLALVIAPLEEGVILSLKDLDYAIITEFELLGKKVLQRRRRKASESSVDMGLKSLAELMPGMPVVHIDFGIGRYLGLTHLVLGGQEGEFVTLEYAAGDKLYVPVSSLHLISRYSGADIEHAPIHRLGGPEWQKIKRKVIEEARDVAAELLEVYARREAKEGFQFPKPDESYEAFRALFPFEETPDQQQAIEAVIQDLTSIRPMDRVICGDVGFGKTEVALRAAFIAIEAHKQVAVLVPTTLLAEQHFQTFTDRFSGLPIRIEVMSRFRTKKEQEKVLEGLQAGTVDILIGTHKILQEGIQFKSLGLLIIDEEHRFGVRQKEMFKALRSEVDILTLTATPIPRTLNMAMSGMRDLSIIATPPARRLAIKTFVRERNKTLIEEAILRELHRGGQVYFLHNAVETIEKEARELEALVPSARIAVAHGQMRERELEKIMSDFYHRRYNVLVCTTIIETGIDIPTANTIIIDRADKFGLAQLHQLRGRVGRSHHQAYAFCLLPPKAKISSDAVKRLDALSAMEELGSGFTLATQDLEIRGAGELLGDAQSGNIQSVGFNLYMELLDHTVKTLKAGGEINPEFPIKKGTEVDLKIPALIPENYIPDVHTRLILYKRISNAKTKEALEDLTSEIIDRFGALPEQTRTLFKLTELRLIAEKLGITKIDAGPEGGRLEFLEKPAVEPEKIIHLLQKMPQIYSLAGPQKLKFRMNLPDRADRIQACFKLMKDLS